MFSEKELGEVLDLALARGGDFSDIFLERKTFTAITLEDRRIERVESGHEAGAGVRVIDGEGTGYAYTSDLSRRGLEEAARLASRVARAGRAIPPQALRNEPVRPYSVELMPAGVAMDDKVEAVKLTERAARDFDPRVRQVKVMYSDVVQEVTMANSHGRLVEDRRVRTRLAAQAVAAEGELTQTGMEFHGHHGGFELFREHPPADIGREAARRAVLMLEARPAPAGKMAVVMAGEAGGTMIHEACGHGLEGDLALRGLSVYAGRVGEKVASELVSVVDDGSLPGYYGSSACDDEGTPSQRTVLIEKGILKGYMLDRLMARKLGVQSTGNGRRESYQHKPIVRMTNTYVQPGDTPPGEIVKETRNGLLVRRMGGGQVNPTNGDFVFQVTEGYLIRDGEVGPAVRGATLTGNGPEALAAVDMVGTDLGFTIGTCGKDGQGVPVSDGMPTLRIPELVVGGILE